ncbi:hypothetical protein [Deinococcus peraridilitoris]|uniref:Uncharacterized protein n=1 Tax=Deinococcus peraridilitoris (strain DSM 19664 / LMG 22246 / CIP 109416 / KR-200) TaxID=937777 RepID=K9ZZ81_DEIPD|nr:hypothetical protein [Deinococcus peraridilitoris]AFZ66953.1 hypothetical protein Deipe_1412 [Deinococcus peraridilitoris DSM 19664]
MHDVPYLDTAHLLTFGEAQEAYRLARLFDPDRRWTALLYLATLTPYLWEAVRPHLDFEGDFADLEQVSGITRGEALVLGLASNLFRMEGAVDMTELADGLDDEVWDIALTALRLYRDS